jgi:AraC-like DNA-binding protein
MASRCPYCESAHSLLMGNVFCSRNHADMGKLESGTLFIRSKKLEETADHVSRLSMRMMISGSQWYKVGGVDRVVHENNFLVVDQGQHYRTAFHSGGQDQFEMAVVAFKPGMAEDVWRSMTASDAALLDDPYQPSDRISFMEHTHRMDPVVHWVFQQLNSMAKSGSAIEKEDVFELHDRLMEHLIRLQMNAGRQSEKINALRRSTRMEIWRRLNRARDLMEACLDQRLTLEQLATTACLSEHHFKRLFKQAFGEPPHRYLASLRMQKARELLHKLNPVGQVALRVGFADVSSFIRAYRLFHGTTPGRTIGN